MREKNKKQQNKPFLCERLHRHQNESFATIHLYQHLCVVAQDDLVESLVPTQNRHETMVV